MCRRQFLQQQSSSQIVEDVARAEVSAQAAVSHIREIGRLMHRRDELLHITGPGGIREVPLHNIFTRSDSVEDDGDEPSLNSGMYS
jgi:hypothetical protein